MWMFHGKWTGLQLTQMPLSLWGLFPALVRFSKLRFQGPQHIWTDSPKYLSLVWESIVRMGGIACNLWCRKLQIIPNYSPAEIFYKSLQLRPGFSNWLGSEVMRKRRKQALQMAEQLSPAEGPHQFLGAHSPSVRMQTALGHLWWVVLVALHFCPLRNVCLAQWPLMCLIPVMHKPHFSPGPSHVSNCFQDWSCRHHPWVIHISRGNCSHKRIS